MCAALLTLLHRASVKVSQWRTPSDVTHISSPEVCSIHHHLRIMDTVQRPTDPPSPPSQSSYDGLRSHDGSGLETTDGLWPRVLMWLLVFLQTPATGLGWVWSEETDQLWFDFAALSHYGQFCLEILKWTHRFVNLYWSREQLEKPQYF